jgi:integrase
MPTKNSGPFLRGKRGIYYCWIDGHLRSLKTKKARLAEGIYREMLKEWESKKKQNEAPAPWTVRQVFNAYLAHVQAYKPNTHRNRKMILDAFRAEAEVGDLPWNGLTENHLEAWLKTKTWSSSWTRSAINYVQSAFNHCLRRERGSGVTENPVRHVQKPPFRRRKAVMGVDDQKKLLDAAKGRFRAILTALLETGARPNELCSAQVKLYRDGAIILTQHKEEHEGEDRVIYLNTVARKVVERAIGSRADGYIFLNSQDERWTPDTLYCRFKRLRKKLGLGEGTFPYAMRHAFASNAINDAAANPALIAKQLGHRGLEVLMKNYFRENPDAMRRALDELRKAGE